MSLAIALARLGLGTSKANAYRPVLPREVEGLPELFRWVYGQAPDGPAG